ncbi:hypothetical protein SETIT_6G040400v2 [Setaria italica]|uniref:Uncharacterized protein n=1 Tax=Setaria italica TaxID=4555 RepID=A0A368RI05_SETIT|nr:hypothetical protein SETIT_6G040400v2 [Setaria italica]
MTKPSPRVAARHGEARRARARVASCYPSLNFSTDPPPPPAAFFASSATLPSPVRRCLACSLDGPLQLSRGLRCHAADDDHSGHHGDVRRPRHLAVLRQRRIQLRHRRIRLATLLRGGSRRRQHRRRRHPGARRPGGVGRGACSRRVPWSQPRRRGARDGFLRRHGDLRRSRSGVLLRHVCSAPPRPLPDQRWDSWRIVG